MKTSLEASPLKMIVENQWPNHKSLPKDLLLAKELVYDRFDFDCTEPEQESESIEYSAYRFWMNEKHIYYREAKITPTKTGQFVTLWKRSRLGVIEPFDATDVIDFVIVSVRKEAHFGQFIFPKDVLLEKAVFSTKTKEGKRAMRVYPPWDIAESKQAKKTQQWQLEYFLFVSNETDLNRAKHLLDKKQ